MAGQLVISRGYITHVGWGMGYGRVGYGLLHLNPVATPTLEPGFTGLKGFAHGLRHLTPTSNQIK